MRPQREAPTVVANEVGVAIGDANVVEVAEFAARGEVGRCMGWLGRELERPNYFPDNIGPIRQFVMKNIRINCPNEFLKSSPYFSTNFLLANWLPKPFNYPTKLRHALVKIDGLAIQEFYTNGDALPFIVGSRGCFND